MVQSLSDREFQQYVQTLEFHNLFELTHFIRAYFEHFVEVSNNGTVEQAQDAYARYAILIAHFGVSYMEFIEELDAKRQVLENANCQPTIVK